MFPARAPSDEIDLGHEGLLLGYETGHGRGAGAQAGYQLALLVSTIAISVIGGLITGNNLIMHYVYAITPCNYIVQVL